MRRARPPAFVRVAAGAIAMCLAAGAAAQGRDPATAEALFREARADAERGEWAAACPKFAESLRLDPAVGTMLNLADCEEQLGNLVAAIERFRVAFDQLGPADDRRPIVKHRIAALEKRTPRLGIQIAPGAPAGTRVTRDGAEIASATFGVALPVNPGRHLVVVISPGHRDARWAVTLAEGQTRQILVEPGDPGQGPPMDAPAPPEAPVVPPRAASGGTGSGGSATAGWIVGGIGLAGLATAGVTGILVEDRKRTVDRSCDASRQCTQDGYDAARSGQTLLYVNAAAWGVGVVGLGVGAWIVLSSDGKPKAAVRTDPAPGGATVSVAGSFR